jgi:AcrR family transcriptional regulator
VTRDRRGERRLEAMRRIQDAALDLFETRGLDRATIEEIASVAGSSAPSVYRYFGTKEHIVLWDEYEPALVDAFAARARRGSLLAALEAAILDELDDIYARDRKRVLRRIRLIEKHPPLAMANGAVLMALRRELAAVCTRGRHCDGLAADVLAGAVVAALEAAVSRWSDGGGKSPLTGYVRRAFRELRALRNT